MTEEEALRQLKRLAQERALNGHVGSDRLIQAGLDALLAKVDTPSLPLLAGLGRREEAEAGPLFSQVVHELGWRIEAPPSTSAAAWARIHWTAEEVVEGRLDPATGADRIWLQMVTELGMSWPYTDDLRPVAVVASNLEDWDEHWDVSLEELRREAFRAVAYFLSSWSST